MDLGFGAVASGAVSGNAAASPSGTASISVNRKAWLFTDNTDEPGWAPTRRYARPAQSPRLSRRQYFAENTDEHTWYPTQRGRAIGPSLAARITTRSFLQAGFDLQPVPRDLGAADPLWVAVEIDLWDVTIGGITTLRLSNRGPLTRTVGGMLYQYEPRLNTPILLGSSLTIFSGGGTGDTPFTMFQQPLRGQPNGGTITWALDPNFGPFDDPLFVGRGSAGWVDPGRFRWLGREFRIYEGRTASDVGVDVDGSGLTLVYAGHVAGLTYDLTASGGPTATVQTTDAQSALDKTLVTVTYPTDLAITTLQGKTVPQLRGRALSIEPALIDSANLIYQVSDTSVIGLDDVTELRVGGVPWDKVVAAAGFVVDTTPTLTNLLAQYAALSPADQAGYNSVVGTDPANYNNGPGLQNKVYLVALYTIYEALTAGQQAQYSVTVSNNNAAYNNTPQGVQSKLNLAKSFFNVSPSQGQWAVDLGAGTVKLGAVTGGAEVRVDAQAVGWQTLDTAQLITDICTEKGVPVDPAYMAQLRLDWHGVTSYYTPAGEAKNALDALDEITLGNLCWWGFGPDGTVIAGVVDGPNQISDFVLFGSNPQVPLDANLLPVIAVDPVPKELATKSLTQLLPPAWRARIGYAKRWAPGSQFLDGLTDQEQSFWRAPELVLDWDGAAAQAGWSLSPTDGTAILQANPRAQDLYISTLAWERMEAFQLRLRLIQRITNTVDHQIYDVTAWMPSAQVRMFQTVTMLWVDEDDRTQAIYGGTYRITSVVRSIGGGPQQLELWGSGGTRLSNRTSSFLAPPIATLPTQTPTGIGFTVSPMSAGARGGDVVAVVTVMTSDGAPFGGSVGFASPFGDDSFTVALNFVTPFNINVILARNLTLGDIGTHNVTVSATEGVTVSNSFSFTVT